MPFGRLVRQWLVPSPGRVPRAPFIGKRKSCVGPRVVGIDRERRLEQRFSIDVSLPGPQIQTLFAAQPNIIDFKALWWLSLRSGQTFVLQPNRQCCHNHPRYVVLHNEDILQRPIVSVRPQMGSCVSIEELSADTNFVARSTYAAFNNIAYTQLLADSLQLEFSAPILKRRVACNDEQGMKA